MHRIGTWGFGPHEWVSVERTRKFYERALRRRFELVDLDAVGEGEPTPPVDAILSFHGSQWFSQPRPADTPIVLAMHGGPVVSHAGLRDRFPHLHRNDTLLLNCRSDAEIMQDLCEGPTPHLVRLPLPVDTELFTPYDQGDCRRELELPPCDHVLGFVCRLVPQKNLHVFLRAFARIREQMAPQRVVALVVGNFHTSYPVLDYGCAQYREHIAALVQRLGIAEDLVCFPANLSDEELAMAFGAMDVLLHPTSAIDENFGYVPVEAMACGVPVVGAAHGGLKDSVRPGVTGALMPTWITRSGIRIDADAGVDAVVRIMSDADRHEAMSVAAAEHASSGYSEAVCSDILCRAFEDAIARRAQGLGETIVTTSPPTPSAEPSLLPPTVPAWESFAEPVARYVETAAPTLTDDSHVRWAAPLVRWGDGRLRLLDPAWPAALPVDLEDDPWVEACAGPQHAASLATPGTARWNTLQRLVDDGLLLVSAAAQQRGAAA
ncbi:MAG: glycosyltransferase [Myxococcota bacterium]